MKFLVIYFLFHDIFNLITCGDSKVWNSVSKSRAHSKGQYYNRIQLGSSFLHNEFSSKYYVPISKPRTPTISKNIHQFIISRQKGSQDRSQWTKLHQLIPKIISSVSFFRNIVAKFIYANETLFIKKTPNPLPIQNPPDYELRGTPVINSPNMKTNGTEKYFKTCEGSDKMVKRSNHAKANDNNNVTCTSISEKDSSNVGEPRGFTFILLKTALIFDILLILFVSPVVGIIAIVAILALVCICIICL